MLWRIFLLFAFLAVGSQAALASCSGHVEPGGSSDEESDWDSAFEKMDAAEAAKAVAKMREDALLEIFLTSAEVGTGKPGLTPETLVREMIDRELGIEYEYEVPGDLLVLARQILAIKLNGLHTEREVAQATKRNELKKELNRKIQEFASSTTLNMQSIDAAEALKNLMISKLLHIIDDLKSYSKNPSPDAFIAIEKLFSDFHQLSLDLGYAGKKAISVLGDKTLAKQLESIVNFKGLSPGLTFRIRGLVALCLDTTQFSEGALPEVATRPFVELDRSKQLYSGREHPDAEGFGSPEHNAKSLKMLMLKFVADLN